MADVQAQLPPEVIDRLTGPFTRFLRREAASGLLLFAAALTALILSNTAWSDVYFGFWETPIGLQFGALQFTRSLKHWINEALMTLFFLVIALELKRALILGELRNLRMAALSFTGALGGMLVPAGVFLAVMIGRPGVHGWGVVMATDTAFVIGCLALFGSRIPATLRIFLLSLAVFDDVGAILVLAFGYGTDLNWLALTLAIGGLLAVAGAAFVGVRSIPAYFLLGGLVWLCLDASGVHPTVAGVVLGLMTPTRGWVSDLRLRAVLDRLLSNPVGDLWSGDTPERQDLKRAATAISETLSPVERLEMMLHPWVAFGIMPLFALANAGVVVSGADFAEPVFFAILLGLVLGKPAGILCFTWLATRFGIAARAPGLGWSMLAAGSCLAGIGFTMSLFISDLAFDPGLKGAATIGILCGSIASAAIGLLILVWLTASGKRGQSEP